MKFIRLVSTIVSVLVLLVAVSDSLPEIHKTVRSAGKSTIENGVINSLNDYQYDIDSEQVQENPDILDKDKHALIRERILNEAVVADFSAAEVSVTSKAYRFRKDSILRYKFFKASVGNSVVSEFNNSAPKRNGSEIVYDRGVLLERYFSKDGGIEQLFDIPSPVGLNSSLIICGTLTSNLDLLGKNSSEIKFGRNGVAEMVYKDAVVIDSDGRSEKLEIDYDGCVVSLVVSEKFLASAKYPLVVDPLIGLAVKIDTKLAATPVVCSNGKDEFLTFDRNEGKLRRFKCNGDSFQQTAVYDSALGQDVDIAYNPSTNKYLIVGVENQSVRTLACQSYDPVVSQLGSPAKIADPLTGFFQGYINRVLFDGTNFVVVWLEETNTGYQSMLRMITRNYLGGATAMEDALNLKISAYNTLEFSKLISVGGNLMMAFNEMRMSAYSSSYKINMFVCSKLANGSYSLKAKKAVKVKLNGRVAIPGLATSDPNGSTCFMTWSESTSALQSVKGCYVSNLGKRQSSILTYYSESKSNSEIWVEEMSYSTKTQRYLVMYQRFYINRGEPVVYGTSSKFNFDVHGLLISSPMVASASSFTVAADPVLAENRPRSAMLSTANGKDRSIIVYLSGQPGNGVWLPGDTTMAQMFEFPTGILVQ